MTEFVKNKEYLEKSKPRHILHVTSVWENLSFELHKFRVTLWAIIHGVFKAAGLEYLGEEVIFRLVVFMAVTPLVILVALLINDNREMRKKQN